MKIGLVGCVKQKQWVPAPAKELYASPLFRRRRRYVESTCDDWFIVSAKHGLVGKQEVLEPHDVTLKSASMAEKRRWSSEVLVDLRSRLGDLSRQTFEIHAGSEYRDFGLVAGLLAAGATVENPTEGLSLGQQLAFYGAADEVEPPHGPSRETFTTTDRREADAAPTRRSVSIFAT